MKILIIEDENRTAEDLKSTLLKIDPATEILELLDSIENAVEYLESQAMPDLIFMDIQLSDGLSFEIFKSVAITCPVIFCTAFDEYAIEAFKMNGVDYVLKPFDDKSIKDSLSKIKKLETHFNSQNYLLEKIGSLVVKQNSYKSGFLVYSKDKMVPISTNDIAGFYVDQNRVFLVTFSNQKYLCGYVMDEIEKLVDPSMFYRANRQFIIHYKSITEIQNYFARKLTVKVTFHTPETIIISKAKAGNFLKWLENR